MWVGGMVPLGYIRRNRKLFIEEDEAERVRTIFRRYLELGSIGLLLADLRERGIVTKVRHLSDGRTVGGIPFTRGPLAYLLRNRFYIGEVMFKGQICPAEHPPILDRDLFEAVQQKLAGQRNGHRAVRARLQHRDRARSPHGARIDEILRNADLALYRSKSEGRNCFQIYSEQMKAEADRRSALEIDLREAIWGDQLKRQGDG
jgi:hypothetical protein